jgi:hypothetical protein
MIIFCRPSRLLSWNPLKVKRVVLTVVWSLMSLQFVISLTLTAFNNKMYGTDNRKWPNSSKAVIIATGNILAVVTEIFTAMYVV